MTAYGRAHLHTVLLFLCIVLARGAALAAETPLAAVAVLQANSPRALALVSSLEGNLVRILESSGALKPLNPSLLRSELTKFGCTDEQCLLGFARDAGVSLIIRAELDDANDFIIMSLRAYGADIPYQGSVVYRYTVRIPMVGKYGPTEFNSITEEHAGIFLSRLLARFQVPLYVSAGGQAGPAVGQDISGTHGLYRPGPDPGKGVLRGFHRVGAARIEHGRFIAGAPAEAGDFILAGFRESAAALDNYAYGRKREMVLKKPAPLDTLYMVLLSGPASATMPIIAPLLGYYRPNDWQGLALWMFNATPYLYLEINGLSNYWANYYKKKRTQSRDVQAQYYFGLYTLCAGGVSLFADAFSYSLLKKASSYQGVQPFLGNAVTAGYLALVAGGAGHFYRGRRLWGYLYYHADNLLLYFTIREFCPEKKYNPLTRSFSTARVNKARAYSLLSAALCVKIAEVVHAVLMRDNVMNGEVIEEGYMFEPVIYSGENAGTQYGMQYSYRW